MTTASHRDPAPRRVGQLIHWAGGYDLLLWLATFGREERLRERLLEPARLRQGEAVLDVGCGTGSLAIVAKRRVGAGSVHGVDASPEMVARAQRKAAKSGADVTFGTAVVQSLPFPDGRFDVVLSTVMLHHVPQADRPAGVAEMRRVLKPGGRLLVVDFARDANDHGFLSHLHRHGHQDARDLMELVSGAGLRIAGSGALGLWGLQFVLGEAPV